MGGLVCLPLFLGLAALYALLAPRQYLSVGEFDVTWRLVDQKQFTQALRDISGNQRPRQCLFRWGGGAKRDLNRVLSGIAAEAGTTRYEIGFFAPQPREAQQATEEALREFDLRFNEPFRKMIRERPPTGIYVLPITIAKRPPLPQHYTLPDTRRVLLLGGSIGMGFALVGLGLLWSSRNSKNVEEP
jgi:hypothetical protein